MFFQSIQIAFSFVLILNYGEPQNSDLAEAGQSFPLSIVGMEDLLKLEREFVKRMTKYVGALEKKVDVMRRSVNNLRAQHKESLKNPEAFLGNPLNSFSLIRRMHEDWIHWVDFIGEMPKENFTELILRESYALPTEEDLKQAAIAIVRIQNIYDLQAEDIARGFLNGKQYNSSLTPFDMLSIGKILDKFDYSEPAGLWLHLALTHDIDEDLKEVFHWNVEKVREMCAKLLSGFNHFEKSLEIINAGLKESPKNYRLRRHEAIVRFYLKNSNIINKSYKVPPTRYKLGCRGHFPERLENLYSLFNTTTNAFLRLAPLKMEHLSMDPYLVMFHNVISDGEINQLKEVAKRRLEPTEVASMAANAWRARSAKGYWLFDPPVWLFQRVKDMTGFEESDYEYPQIINYGIGGHYKEHYDFYTYMEEVKKYKSGNRIATVMFYLSDVEEGGATVFPYIPIGVYPRKGSALVWYNLHDNGETDFRTLHGSCPVIVGSKWITTVWIIESDQFRARPCNR